MKFKKIVAVLGSFALIGATLGAVSPLSFDNSNVGDTAIVYGAGAAASDVTGANQINDYLNSLVNISSIVETNVTEVTENVTSDFSSSIGITEDEIVLGGSILIAKDSNKIKAILTDSKISTLLDGEIEWDNALSAYDNDFNIHEVLEIGNDLETKTTFDNNDLNGTALVNDRALTYKYIFEEDIFDGTVLDLTDTTYTDAGEDAGILTVSILGQDYDVEEFTSDSITISSSDEKIVKVGDVFIVDGVTLTINDVFENVIQVNDVLIKEDSSKRVNGIKVQVDSIAYHSTGTSLSKAIIKVGEEISTTYNNGDDYIGEDEDDPEWIWTIENPGKINGWIGVTYDLRQVDEEDSLVYGGDAYIFPENYAAIQFNGLTNVDYDRFELFFEDNARLYDSSIVEINHSAQVMVLKGINEDSFEIVSSGIESKRIALHYDGTDYNLYYDDEENNNKFVLSEKVTLDTNFGRLVVDDNILNLKLNSSGLFVGDMLFDLNKTVSLGLLEDSESSDIVVEGKPIGNYEEDVLTHSGIIIENPESNADEDEVIFQVPSEQVYASISVLGQGEVTTSTSTITEVPQTGSMIVLDTEISSVQDKNLIIVGGSCINSVAARVLGISAKTCGADFTALTTVGAGQYMVKEYASPYNAAKTAVVVAGYDAADTTNGVDTYLTSLKTA